MEWRKEYPDDALAAEEEVIAEITRRVAEMRNPRNVTYSAPVGKEYSKFSFIIGFLLGAFQVFLTLLLLSVALYIIGEFFSGKADGNSAPDPPSDVVPLSSGAFT